VSATSDELRASVARILRGTTWSILVLMAVGAALHLAGAIVLPPAALTVGVVLLVLSRWQARLVERGQAPRRQFIAFHLIFVAGITVINHDLGGIRFPAATFFYALLVANSGFDAPLRYLFANLSAAAYALLLGLEQWGVLPRAPGPFPASAVAVPPWPAQVAFLLTFTASLNLLAAVTQRLLGLLEWSRQRLAHANLELEGWRQSLAEQVQERTRALEAANVELDARARALEERSHRLRTFVYTVTHDLKTPINNILLRCDLMLARDGSRLGEDDRRELDRIAQLASRAEDMIRDLFSLFKITSAQEQRRWVALDQIVRLALDDLAPQVDAKGIAVRVEPLPEVWGAPGKLRHLVVNLLANAVKYAPAGAGSVVVGGQRGEARSAFFVRDDGPGIAPEYHQGIFKLFGRVPDDSDSTAGTGVGLAVVAGIVEEHHGRVWVESAPGAGSTFHVELPFPAAGDPIPA
jgi:signal transduction histidine kinase